MVTYTATPPTPGQVQLQTDKFLNLQGFRHMTRGNSRSICFHSFQSFSGLRLGSASRAAISDLGMILRRSRNREAGVGRFAPRGRQDGDLQRREARWLDRIPINLSRKVTRSATHQRQDTMNEILVPSGCAMSGCPSNRNEPHWAHTKEDSFSRWPR